MAKFKVNDFIRLADKNDPMYTRHGYWRVVRVQKTSYVLWSYTHRDYVLATVLKPFLKQTNYKNMMEFIDNSYRLLTDAEKVLYVKSK